MGANIALFYIHDPMCSWCWAFRPALSAIVTSLPKVITKRSLLGGLAPDSDQPMAEDMRRYVQNHWRTIQKRVPGTEFNFDFWEKCAPRRATYPACRAVIAARMQGGDYDDPMTLAIQKAYYLQARNPSDNATLIELADEIGLDINQFTSDLSAASTRTQLEAEIKETRQMGVKQFPSMVLAVDNEYHNIAINYTDAASMSAQLQALLGHANADPA